LGKKTPYGQIFTNVFQNDTCGHGNTSFSANFVKFGPPEVGEIARYLMEKKNIISAPAPAAASSRIAPKICQGQLQTIYSEFPKFHPNPFTSGRVIAKRVNIVQTRHKVFAILGEASASSPSKNCQRQSCSAINCLSSGINMLAGGRPLPSEILPPSDLPSPVNGILWEMSELITQEWIAVGSSNLVEGLTT